MIFSRMPAGWASSLPPIPWRESNTKLHWRGNCMLERLLERIALALEECGISYMVIGGQAVLVYGVPRLTQDVDVTLGVGADRLGEILDLVKAQDWQVLVPEPEEFV